MAHFQEIPGHEITDGERLNTSLKEGIVVTTDGNIFECKVCKKNCTGSRQIEDHIRGKSHLKEKVRQERLKSFPLSLSSSEQVGPGVVYAPRIQVPPLIDVGRTASSAEWKTCVLPIEGYDTSVLLVNQNSEYYCKACDVTMNNHLPAVDHLRGKPHEKKFRRYLLRIGQADHPSTILDSSNVSADERKTTTKVAHSSSNTVNGRPVSSSHLQVPNAKETKHEDSLKLGDAGKKTTPERQRMTSGLQHVGTKTTGFVWEQHSENNKPIWQQDQVEKWNKIQHEFGHTSNGSTNVNREVMMNADSNKMAGRHDHERDDLGLDQQKRTTPQAAEGTQTSHAKTNEGNAEFSQKKRQTSIRSALIPSVHIDGDYTLWNQQVFFPSMRSKGSGGLNITPATSLNTIDRRVEPSLQPSLTSDLFQMSQV